MRPRRKRNRFEIGDWVVVSAITRRVRAWPTYEEFIVRSYPCGAQIGQVCGQAVRTEGAVEMRTVRGADEYGPEVKISMYRATRNVTVYQIRQSLRGRPIEVQEQHMRAATPEEIVATAPLPICGSPAWSKENIDALRANAAQMTRDTSGRFVADA